MVTQKDAPALALVLAKLNINYFLVLVAYSTFFFL